MQSAESLTLYASPGVDVNLDTVAVEDVALVSLASGAAPTDLATGVWVVGAAEFGATPAAIAAALQALPARDNLALVLVAEVEQTFLSAEADARVFAYLNPKAPGHLQAKILRSALVTVRLRRQQEQMASGLQARDRQLKELNNIGVALSAERDVDSLLGLILSKARQITCADAGSLYLVEDAEGNERRLRFKLSQNDSFDLDYTEFTMPLNTRSLAGYAGVTGETLRLADVYDLPEDAVYSFSTSWDEQTGYRTKSMLVVPMMNNKGEIRGVLQLINRKPTSDLKLTTRATFEAEVIGFEGGDQELVESLASQAAVALENQLLLANISSIFEGVLMGWVKAVEDRDPATAGHSHRVTVLTLALAREVNRCTTGPYADVHFSQQQLEELRYAGLLHDIGKIYVRVDVFLKAKKLYAHHLKMIQERFDFVRRTLEAEYNRKKLQLMIDNPRSDYARRFEEIDRGYRTQLEQLDEYFETVLLANEPTVLEEGRFERLAEIAGRTYEDVYGNTQHLLQSDELRLLNIRRGNLDESERREIESHVEWSYRILSRIPWSPELQQIPFIAWAHHEKLDGTGYPNKLNADQIPLQAKIMTIADIYDALTAADRPYKKAQPIESALRILGFERNDNHIDAELLRLFSEKQVYKLAHVDRVEDLVNRLVYEDVQ
ncbi:MAG: GAF domain-containing protein [Fimbriimonadaceae bacterium]|nr:GAF domain-containing protein [Fimbriimonadaceae bacterium]